jgi:hypothetical protein
MHPYMCPLCEAGAQGDRGDHQDNWQDKAGDEMEVIGFNLSV